MLKRTACSIVALVACTSFASAADLGPYEPYGGSVKDEPIAGAPFSWTGFHLGANVGHGWGEFELSNYKYSVNGVVQHEGDGGKLKPDGGFGGGIEIALDQNWSIEAMGRA